MQHADRGGRGDGRQTGREILHRLGEDAELAAQFRTAFPEEPQVTQAERAQGARLLCALARLAADPVRCLGRRRRAGAAGPLRRRGFRLFIGKAGCVLCHVGWRFTDDRFHDVGLPGSDGGRGAVPGGTPGLMAFKTPSLREVANTAPYMHDGSLATLEAVIAHYAGGFVRRPSLATNMNRDLRLSAREKSDLVAFLRTLSSEKGPARAKRAGPP